MKKKRKKEGPKKRRTPKERRLFLCRLFCFFHRSSLFQHVCALHQNLQKISLFCRFERRQNASNDVWRKERSESLQNAIAFFCIPFVFFREFVCQNERRDEDEVDGDGDDFRDGSKTKFLENCGSDAFCSPTKEENDKDDDESQSCEERRRRRE